MASRIYTPEIERFIRENVKGTPYVELAEMLNKRFKHRVWEVGSVKSFCRNNKITNGRNTRFKKGQISHNKGRKGWCPKGCEATWFQKGHLPANHRPVGSERVNVEGYIEIKVAEPNKWRAKHVVVWEEQNGTVPKDSAIVFLDGDKLNTDISNLECVARKELLILNQDGLIKSDGEITKAGVNVAKLKARIWELKRQRKKVKSDDES